MYQFFVEDEQMQQKIYVTIEGSDVNHIKNVLRMKTGRENPCVATRSGQNYFCSISGYYRGRLCVQCGYSG